METRATKKNTRIGDILILTDNSVLNLFDGLKAVPVGEEYEVLEKFDHTFRAKRLSTKKDETGLFCYFRFEHKKEE
ncbi:MAG TPA: hypothetical protein VGB37_05145 [Candidatus Lokiarchaeia archaeon]